MQEMTSTRSNALIDPSVHIWHGEVAGYLFLGGVVAGVMVLMGLRLLLDRRDGATTPSGTPARSLHLGLLPWTVPVLLSVGMFFLWLDLENPWNAFRFYLVFRVTSPMSWGSWILLAIYPASLALAWRTTPAASRTAALGWVEARTSLASRWPRGAAALSGLGRWVDEHDGAVAWANVVAGAGLGIYTGMLLGTMASRPLWNSAVLGPLFLTSGLSTGAAYMLLYRLNDGERLLLARVDMGLIVAELALISIWLIGLTTGGASHREAAFTVLGGPWTTAFWTLVVCMGLVVPFLGEWLEQRGGHVPGRLAAVLVLAGGFALRWIIVYAGQHAGWDNAPLALF
ncbi:MAG TPA: NrfD/PsrC family molybdoenzyme membrane anchor subunit [Longimicrobiales bacterium]|nr:NrfD/PsrC family molybdoenzyme membrane anchor subunit [Longimicrobiales bacterium]